MVVRRPESSFFTTSEPSSLSLGCLGPPGVSYQEAPRAGKRHGGAAKRLQDASKSLQDASKCLARATLSPNLLPGATPGPSEPFKHRKKQTKMKLGRSPPQTLPRRPKTPQDAPRTPLRRPRKPPRRAKTPSGRPQDAPRRSQEAPKTPPEGGKLRSESACHQDRGPKDTLEANLDPK